MAEKLPKPWYQVNLEDLDAGLIVEEDGKKYGYLVSIGNKKVEGSVLQNISPMSEWLGQRVRLTAKIKTELSSGVGSLFMQIDGQYYLASDSMNDRKIIGETDWQEYAIVLDMPDEPMASVLFGVNLNGNGMVYFDDFSFEVVDHDVLVSGEVVPKKKKGKPYNLDFETDLRDALMKRVSERSSKKYNNAIN